MNRFIGRRLLASIPQLFAASLVVFLVLRLLPGDVVLSMLADTPHTLEMREALRDELGLNDPLPVQYLRWIWETVSGFRGISRSTGEPIRSLLATQLPVTLLLSFYSLAIALVVSMPLGVVAAGGRRSLDLFVDGMALLGIAVPGLWLALLLLLMLLSVFSWSPPIIYFGPLEAPGEHLALMIWPTLLLAWEHIAHLVPVVRAETRDAASEPFFRASLARGLSRRRALWRHAGKHAVRPLVLNAAIQFGTALGSTLVLETIFGIPGIGRGLVAAAVARDLPTVQTMVLVLIALFLLAALVADVAVTVLDPRVRRGMP